MLADNAAERATRVALKALCQKGLLRFVYDKDADGKVVHTSGRYIALPKGKAAFTALLAPGDAVAVHDELSWCGTYNSTRCGLGIWSGNALERSGYMLRPAVALQLCQDAMGSGMSMLLFM